jgi:hypothetical protein
MYPPALFKTKKKAVSAVDNILLSVGTRPGAETEIGLTFYFLVLIQVCFNELMNTRQPKTLGADYVKHHFDMQGGLLRRVHRLHFTIS